MQPRQLDTKARTLHDGTHPAPRHGLNSEENSNHPGGEPQPSAEDKQITKKIVEGSKTLGIEVLDHLIITEENYFSFSENKLL